MQHDGHTASLQLDQVHLVDTTILFAPHSGGIKRYLLAKRDALARRRGITHTLVVPGAASRVREPGLVEVRAARVPHPAGYRVPLQLREWRAVLERLAPDVIEAGDPYHGAWAALSVARSLGIPAVAFAHSDLPQLVESVTGSAGAAVARAYVRRLYRRFDLVLAPSRRTARHLREAGIDDVAVQPLGVDASVFDPAREDPELRRQLGVAPDVRLLVFAGRLSREKRIPVLIEAVELLGPQYHLLLVGGTRTERIASAVSLLAYEQDASRLARVVASADAFVHAGVQETFGLVLVEAMACGTPVVAVRAGAAAELVDASVGMLAERSDAHSMASAIATLFERDVEALAGNARRRAVLSHSWDAVFTAQLARYHRLLGAAHQTMSDEVTRGAAD